MSGDNSSGDEGIEPSPSPDKIPIKLRLSGFESNSTGLVCKNAINVRHLIRIQWSAEGPNAIPVLKEDTMLKNIHEKFQFMPDNLRVMRNSNEFRIRIYMQTFHNMDTTLLCKGHPGTSTSCLRWNVSRHRSSS